LYRYWLRADTARCSSVRRKFAATSLSYSFPTAVPDRTRGAHPTPGSPMLRCPSVAELDDTPRGRRAPRCLDHLERRERVVRVDRNGATPLQSSGDLGIERLIGA